MKSNQPQPPPTDYTRVAPRPIPSRKTVLFASFCASHIAETEVVTPDVRNPKVLLKTKAPEPLYKLQGRFSLDGRFFVCETLAQGICLWENTPTGYVPKDRLTPIGI